MSNVSMVLVADVVSDNDIRPHFPPAYDAERGRLTLPPNSRAYGIESAAQYLGVATWKARYERDKMGRLVGVTVGQCYILTEAELNAWREWRGLGPFVGERPAHVQTGPSGVLLTREGVALALGKKLETISRGIGFFMGEQKIGGLTLYKLEDVEAFKAKRGK